MSAALIAVVIALLLGHVFPSLPLLRRLVQFGDETARELRRGVERGREALESVREAAEKGVQQLVGKRGKGKRGGSLLEELLEAPQRTLDDLQHRIDAQVRQSVERVTSHPALRNEYVAAYSVLQAMGLLTVAHLQLGIETYDPEVNFERVRGGRPGGYDTSAVDRIRARWQD